MAEIQNPQSDAQTPQLDTQNTQPGAKGTKDNSSKKEKKKSIFDKFNWITEQSEDGKSFAFNCYRRYMELFNSKDRDVLANFETLYHDKGMKALVHFNDDDSAVIYRFIAFTEWLPSNRFFGWLRNIVGRCMSTNELLEWLDCAPFPKKDDTTKLKPFVKEQDFVTYRYFAQQQYFSNTAGKYKKTYYLLQKFIQGLSLSVSVCSLFFIFFGNCYWSGENDVIPRWFGNLDNLIVAIVSAIAAYLSSNEKLCRNLEFWLKFRTTSERLKTEYSLYQGRCGVYDIKNDTTDENGNSRATKRFRAKVEEIVQTANDSFERIIQGDSAQISGRGDGKTASSSGDGSGESKEKDGKKGEDDKKDGDSKLTVQTAPDKYGTTLVQGGLDSLISAMRSIKEEKAEMKNQEEENMNDNKNKEEK